LRSGGAAIDTTTRQIDDGERVGSQRRNVEGPRRAVPPLAFPTRRAPRVRWQSWSSPDRHEERTMSMFDKAKDLLNEHADQVDEGIDKLGDLVDEKTGGEHADKVDTAQEKLKEGLDKLNEH
jgi:hypothetical protein